MFCSTPSIVNCFDSATGLKDQLFAQLCSQVVLVWAFGSRGKELAKAGLGPRTWCLSLQFSSVPKSQHGAMAAKGPAERRHRTKGLIICAL